MKKNIQGFRLWLSGKPKRIYRDSDAVRCPKCGGNYDKALYGSDICKRCGAPMKPIKEYITKYSGKPEMEQITER